MLDRKIYLSTECSKFLESFGMCQKNFDEEYTGTYDLKWENDSFIVRSVQTFDVNLEIEQFVWPKTGQFTEILKDDDVIIITPILYLQAYRLGAKFTIDEKVSKEIRKLDSLGYSVFDNEYYIVDNKICFDYSTILKRKDVLNIPKVKEYTFLTALKKYHNHLPTIKKHKMDEFNCRSKLEPQFVDSTRNYLYEKKISNASIERLVIYGKLTYNYQSGDSQIWISDDMKYVVKLNPYTLLFNHEVEMMKLLEEYNIVPTIYDYWSFPSENIMVMSFHGFSLASIYYMKEIAPDFIQLQIKNIIEILASIGLEHLDAHVENWLIDNDKVWLIDLEHLVYIDRTKIKDKLYLKHLDLYFI